MRTVEEIKEYLMIDNHTEISLDNIIKKALFIEDKYLKDIEKNHYGYALLCDFINSPFILEDEDEVDELKVIERVGDLIVYEPIFSKED